MRSVNRPPDESSGEQTQNPKSHSVQTLARLAKALAHPIRVEIVRFLSQRGECICGDIVGQLPLAQSTVSAHLKKLREAGLVSSRREGSSVHYCANPGVLEHLRELLGALGTQANWSAIE